MTTLAHVTSARYTSEQCFEEAKDDVGLDHYEVRSRPSWHRYITLGMMALAWLAFVRGHGRCGDAESLPRFAPVAIGAADLRSVEDLEPDQPAAVPEVMCDLCDASARSAG
ncbi:hypothetical protein [Sorangium sp. So ce1000]|uniref:hypothetical protein n=1 Tax=Sorangium sp. So ce1000 TaxID=3133325 RepID=UPI003F5DC011